MFFVFIHIFYLETEIYKSNFSKAIFSLVNVSERHL